MLQSRGQNQQWPTSGRIGYITPAVWGIRVNAAPKSVNAAPKCVNAALKCGNATANSGPLCCEGGTSTITWSMHWCLNGKKTNTDMHSMSNLRVRANRMPQPCIVKLWGK